MGGMRGLVQASVVLALVLASSAPVGAADSDGDGLRDAFEQRYGLTDPNRRDSDRDGVVDSAEDNDRDGLGNRGEQRFGTNPRKRDTDGDGTTDAREDANRNGVPNGKEQDRRKVPSGLRPSLSKAREDKPPMGDTCLTPFGKATARVCRFGPSGSKRVALVGDSHALMWSSPVKNVAVAKGWRILVYTKSACPPLLGLYTWRQLATDGGTTCQQWRHNVIDRLKANPPDLIIITQADTYGLRTRTGEKIAKSEYQTKWKRALRRTLEALPGRSHVLVLGDVPRNDVHPQRCLKDHPNDMSRCVTRRVPNTKRTIELGLRRTAEANGAEFRTLYGKICSYDPCPVVQGKILMWRGKGHITETFALQLQPSVRTLIERAIE